MYRTLIIALAACAALDTAFAFRVLEPVENGIELGLVSVQLPSDSSGSVTYRTCETCPTQLRRLNAATQYFVDGSLVALADLNAVAADLRATQDGAQSTLVMVFYSIATDDVTRITLHRAD